MTVDPTRAELLKALAELGQAPRMKLGQMLGNLATSAARTDARGVWDLEDGDGLFAAQRLLERRHLQLASRT